MMRRREFVRYLAAVALAGTGASGCFDGAGVAPCSISCSLAQPCGDGLTCRDGRCAEPGLDCAAAAPVLHLDLVGPGTVSRGSLEVLCDSTAGDRSCDVPWDGPGSDVLMATGAAAVAFAGWSGACAGTSTCTLERGMSHRVGASFGNTRRMISVAITGGEGEERVVSDPPGLDCGAGTCAAVFLPADTVTLNAGAGPSQRWRTDASWLGPCTSTDPTHCVVAPGNDDVAIGYAFVRTPLVTLQVMGADDYHIVGALGTCTRAAPCAPTRLDAGSTIELTAQVTDTGQVASWSCPSTSCLISGVRDESVSTVLGGDDLNLVAMVGPGFAVTVVLGNASRVTAPRQLAAIGPTSTRASFLGPLQITGTTTGCTAQLLGTAGCTAGACMGDLFTCDLTINAPRVVSLP